VRFLPDAGVGVPKRARRSNPPPGAMLPSPGRVVRLMLPAMDLTSRVLVVLGFVAGAVTGAIAVAGLLLAAGMDAHAVASQLSMAIGGACGAVVGARANLASGRQLVAERAVDVA
jgi:hypothetical protein